jgi:hypothetical protein
LAKKSKQLLTSISFGNIMAASIKYFIKSTIPTFTDWSWYLNGFTVANTQVEFFGGTQADSVRVGAGASANLNDVFASTGNDTLYLTGNFEDYTQTVVGSVYTFTRKGSTSEVISFVSGADDDVVYFANGHVVVGGTSAQPNGRSSLQNINTGNLRLIEAGDLVAGGTPTNPQSGVPSPNTTKVKIVVTGTSDVDIAELQTSGMSAEIYGGGGVDKFYVRQGTSANAQQMFTSRGNDVLYLTGNFSEYTQNVNGTVYTFTRNDNPSEVVSFVSGNDDDVVYFKDGHFVVGASSAQPNRRSALQDPNTGDFRLIDANDMVAGGTPLPPSANAPKISSIAIDSATGAVNQTLNERDVVSIKVTMSEAVTVSGTPRLKLDIGGTEVWADYSAGTGTATLTFKYTIQDKQTDANGISIPSNALDLNNGTIKSTSSSLDASLTNDTVADNASYGVDATAPTISSKTTGAIAPGADLSLTVSEVVSKSSSGSITIYRTDNSVVEAIDINSDKISLNSTSGTSTTITINPTQDLMAGTSYYAKISDGAFQDKAGNNLKGITDQSWTFNAANLSTTVNSKVGANADSQINTADLGTWSLSGTVNDNGLGATNIAIKSITFTSTDLLTVVTLTSSTPGLAMPTVGADKTWKLASSTIWTDLLVSSKTYSVSVELSGQVGSTPTLGSGTLPTNLSYDVSAPTSPTLKLAVDSGSSSQDFVTNDGMITVSQLESGSTWQYSVDSGRTWQTGDTPNAGVANFKLTSDIPRATFIAGQIQVRQTDAAGNTSREVVTFDKTLVLDTFATDKPTFIDVPTTDNKEKPTLKVNFSPESSQSTFGAVSGDVVEIYEGLVKLGSATLTATDISNKWVNVIVDLTLLNRTSLDGSHIFKSKIVDAAGNSSAFSDAVTYTLDTRPPSGGTGMKLKSVTSSSSDPTLDDAYTNQDSGSAVFIYTGTDLVTGERFQYSKDNGTTWADVSSTNLNTTTKTITIDSLDLKNSPNVQIRAIDAVGNAITLANQQITYDNVAPTGGSGMSFTNVSSSGSTTGAITSLASGSVVFTYEGADLAAGERFQYRVGTGTWADVSSTNISTNTVTIDGLPLSGSPNIQIRAVDRAGNATAALANQQITYDNVAPTGGSGMSFTKVISADSTQTGAITNIATGSVVFTYTGAGLATGERFQYSKDNGTTWSDVSSTNINTTDKTVTIGGLPLSSSPIVKIRAIDAAGNATGTLASQQITYDNTAPQGITSMSFTSVSSSTLDQNLSDAITNQDTGSVVFTYTGTGLATDERFQYSKDNGTTWADVGSANISGKTITIDGVGFKSSPIVKIRAVDLAGNTAAQASQQITYDNTAPQGITDMSFTKVSSSLSDPTPNDANTNQDTGSVVFTYTGTGLTTGDRFQYSLGSSGIWLDVSPSNLSGKTVTIDTVDLKSNPNISIRAIDSTGNATALASQQITYDNTAPTGGTDMSFTSVSSSALDQNLSDATTNQTSGSVVFTYMGADLATDERFQYSKDNGITWADVSSTNTTANTVTIDGLDLRNSPKIQIRAVDLAGNATALATQKITYDGTTATTASIVQAADTINATSRITSKEPTRYLLIVQPTSTPWDPSEIEVMSNGVNVASNKAVYVGAQGSLPLYAASNLVDGSTSTSYNMFFTPNDIKFTALTNQWLMVDLGASYAIDSVTWKSRDGSTDQDKVYAERQSTVEIFASNTSFMASDGAKLTDHGKLDDTTLTGLRNGAYANTQILKIQASNTENSISTQSTTSITKPTLKVYFSQNAAPGDLLDILDGKTVIERRSLSDLDILNGYVILTLEKPLGEGGHALKAIITDTQGNQSTNGEVISFSLNSLSPTLSLEKDTGTVGDNNTSNGQVNITNLASGASWQYSTDNGTTWKDGTGSSFTLSKGTYADGYIQARQTANSKTSDINKLGGGKLVVDTDAPSYIAITSVYSGTQTTLIPAKQALTRYLLIYNPDNAPWDPAELEVFSNGVNVALNKTVTVGSQGAFSADYGGSKLVDGKTDTNYHNNYNQTDVLDKQWLMVDLGASYQIDQINWKSRVGLSTLNPYYNARQNSVAIYTSNSDFTTSMSLTDSNGNAQTLTTEKVKTLEAGGYANYKVLQVASANTLAVNSTTYLATNNAKPSFKINFAKGADEGDTITLYEGSGQSNPIHTYTLTKDDITNGYASFTLGTSLSNGAHAFTAVFTDKAGHTTKSDQAMILTVDATTTTPNAPTLTLAQDTGKSSDRVTSNGTVIVSGLDTGASWEYSTDTGSTWKTGSGASFTLGNGTYADGAVQVRQTGANGKLSSTNTAFKSVQVQPNSPNDLSIVSVTDYQSSSSGSLMSSREPTRYLLIVKPDSGTWDPAELEVFSEGVNVALNKTVTVGSQGTLSSTTSGTTTTSYVGANLVDGKNTTFYQTQDNSTASNQWIMVDLGASYSIDRVNWVRRSDTSNSTKDASYAANQKKVEMYASNVDFLASTGLGTSNALSDIQLANLRKGAYVNTQILEISSTTASPAVTNSSTTIAKSTNPTVKIQFTSAAKDDEIALLLGEAPVFPTRKLLESDITRGYVEITISNPLSDGDYTLKATLKSATTGTTYTSSSFNLRVGATAPGVPTMSLNATDKQTIDVTGLVDGGTWQYSVDSGATWSNGVGSSFALSNQTYQAGSVKVKQTSAAGVISGTATNALSLTVSKTLLTKPTLTLTKDTGTDGDYITSNGTIKVEGLATGNLWKYSVDGGTNWKDGSGTSFSLNAGTYGVNKILVKQTDSLGTTTSAMGSNANQFTIESTNVTLALNQDAGSSNTDGVTSDGTINVTGLASGQAWEYSTDWGATWSTGVNNSFTLASGQYAANSVQVKLSYVNTASGTVKPVAYLTSQVTVDQSTPGALGMNLAIGSGEGTSNGKVTVSGLVSNATWKYSTDSGLSWQNGSGTSFDLSDGTYSANKVQVKQISVAGKESTINQMAGSFTVGANVHDAKLNADTGTSATDGHTNDKKVNVSGLLTGATWSYSTDSGKTWQAGNGTSFDLFEGAYASKAIQVKQTQSSGTNTVSRVSKMDGAITLDTIVPSSIKVVSATDTVGDNKGSSLVSKKMVRYIMVVKPEIGEWDPVELEVFSGGVNVALNKTVKVGNQGTKLTERDGSKLVDGKENLYSYYYNNDQTNVTNQWIMVDLGESYAIDRVNWVGRTWDGATKQNLTDSAARQKSVEIYGSNTDLLTSIGIQANKYLDADQLNRLKLGLYDNTQLLKVDSTSGAVFSSSYSTTDSELPTLKIAFSAGAMAGDYINLYDNGQTTAIERIPYTITDADIKNGYALITLTSKLSSGDHDITAKLTDTAGNAVTSSAGFKFTVDTTTMTLSTAANAGTNGITPDTTTGLVTVAGSDKTLDLTTVTSSAWDHQIKTVDLTGTGSSANNKLIIDATSIVKLATYKAYDSSSARYQLLVNGDAGDKVDLQGGSGTTGWIKQTAAYTTTTATYDVWHHDTNDVAVFINRSITSISTSVF